MALEYNEDDLDKLDFGQYPEVFPQMTLRAELSANLSRTLTHFGIDLPSEEQSEAIKLHRIAGFQIDSLTTALSHTSTVSVKAVKDLTKTVTLHELGYLKFIENPVINDGDLERINVNNILDNLDGTFTVSAFLNGKLIRQALVHPRTKTTLVDINFFYTNDGKSIEVRGISKQKSVIIYPTADLPVQISERDWIDRQTLTIDDNWEIQGSSLIKVGQMEVAGEKKNIIEYYHPAINSTERIIKIYNSEKQSNKVKLKLSLWKVNFKLHKRLFL
jgi:hypothetical protein